MYLISTPLQILHMLMIVLLPRAPAPIKATITLSFGPVLPPEANAREPVIKPAAPASVLFIKDLLFIIVGCCSYCSWEISDPI
jgi:hypothetical protein